MVKVSVVIPCYNSSRYVERTVESVLGQSMGDFELICVDNGSSDDTLEILNRMAAGEPRMRVASEPEKGEGPARDAGYRMAGGEWLYFLDSDDLMEPTLLEEAVSFGEAKHADVVVFRTRELDDQTGEIRSMANGFSVQNLPAGIDAFCPRDYPDHLFSSFENWVHNKLFRGDYVRSHDISFQHVHRSADLLFTCRALAEADTIALLDRPLHRYRVNNPESAIQTSDRYPLDFLAGFAALRESLEEHGLWDTYRLAFVNWALGGIAYNLHVSRSYEGFKAIADALREGGFTQLGLDTVSREQADDAKHWDECTAVNELPLAESMFLFFSAERDFGVYSQTKLSQCRNKLAEVKDENARLRIRAAESELACEQWEEAYREIAQSETFAIGTRMATPVRTVKALLGRDS